ncbi:phage holin family protein [Aegicerativicinus sediminis]
MKLLIRLLVTGILVLLIANFLPGVQVESYLSAVIVAIVLALLNVLLKPILVILTLPVTILTFGLFLLVINAIIILLASSLIGGFDVDGFWIAVLFSILLSICQAILFSWLKED